jgi:hypothetical protein
LFFTQTFTLQTTREGLRRQSQETVLFVFRMLTGADGDDGDEEQFCDIHRSGYANVQTCVSIVICTLLSLNDMKHWSCLCRKYILVEVNNPLSCLDKVNTEREIPHRQTMM